MPFQVVKNKEGVAEYYDSFREAPLPSFFSNIRYVFGMKNYNSSKQEISANG